MSAGGEAQGGEQPQTQSIAELVEKAEQLVRQAVGFDAARGDTLTVTTVPFYQPPPLPEIEAPSFFASPKFFSMLRQGLSVVAILLVGFGLVRPIVRMITAPTPERSGAVAALPGASAVIMTSQLSYDEKVGAVRQLVDRDSERVARIVKEWVGADG
jgi:flagellar M-ring protein FliF